MLSFTSLLSLCLALFGLSFLIFIHELGHYYIARRLGMKVDTFSIGFGRPIYRWNRDGVRWQIGWLLFGGFVKIEGMDSSDGSTGKKSPVDRIKVCLAGPLANIAFALLAFTALWLCGGRVKKFSEHTHVIGWIDPASPLFERGVRPGDEIIDYNHTPFQGAKEHTTIPMLSGATVQVHGLHIDPNTQSKQPFEATLHPYPHPGDASGSLQTIGILSPASYVIYDRLPDGTDNPVPTNTPLYDSGLAYGDRIIWADGVTIHSLAQLSHVLNEEKALLTIQRDQETLLRRVPRVHVSDLKLDHEVKEELIDWQFAAELNQTRIQNLFMIPYNLNASCTVEGRIPLIDHTKEASFLTNAEEVDAPLQEGDQILAVDGIPVLYSYELLLRLQQHRVFLIVQQLSNTRAVLSTDAADQQYHREFALRDLHALAAEIGKNHPKHTLGHLRLLKPVVPQNRQQLSLSPELKPLMEKQRQAEQQELSNAQTPEERAHIARIIAQRDQQLFLGIPSAQDLTVRYNPRPISLFVQVFDEIRATLTALFSGNLNPKWMSGPIGIVQLVHSQTMNGWKEGLFWLGAISLNLGLINLLPLPVLDGGTIALCLYEWITGKRIHEKVLEKVLFAFALLLIAFFIYLSYHDLLRLFHS